MQGRRFAEGGARTRCMAVLIVALSMLINAPLAIAASGIRLVMVQEVGCRFCRQWEADIGHAYDASPEAQFAPISRVMRDAAEIRGLSPIVYTPTFLVLRDGKEVGRLTGYPGKDYFWPELDAILLPLGFQASH